jgi:hypothetical protein
VFTRQRPAAAREAWLYSLPTPVAARIIWTAEFGWTPAEVAAGAWIIDGNYYPENDSWNPCRAWNEDKDVSCAHTRARNGMYLACGIGQRRPCKLLGRKLAQLRDFVVYITGRYSNVFNAKAYKEATTSY